jgi:glycosyltransferase involved in cell wall biosynthesis
MKKMVVVRGPCLTASGYGEHTRFVLRSLRKREDQLEIHILPTGWGETGWLSEISEERSWIDEKIQNGIQYMQTGKYYDMSVQVTIPNEWKPLAPINIGITAGIECNKVSPVWLEKANEMDKVITISQHSKNGFISARYEGVNKHTGQPMNLMCTTDIDVVGYPVKTYEPMEPILDLEYDFNFLTIAQWGPRKNLFNTIKWFVEENIDQKVGLVVKTSLKNNSTVDREYSEQMMKSVLDSYPERKCKVYLLHGDMTEQELHSLYIHPKIKGYISLTHGEGYGLPLFESAYSGLPIIAPGWSGQCDFLYMPETNKKSKKNKKRAPTAMFAEVDFTIGPVPDSAIWEGVIDKGTMWAFPTEGSFKMRLRQVRKSHKKWLAKAARLQQWVKKEFECEKLHDMLSSAIYTPEEELDIDTWLDELSTQLVEHE